MSYHHPAPTGRLRLRPCSLADAPFFLELLNRPEWLDNIGNREVYNLAAAEDYIADKILPAYKQAGVGNWMVERKSDGTCLGCVGVYVRPGLDAPDFGFSFLAEHHGQGYALEASYSARAFAVANGIKELKAITLPTNQPSLRLLDKLGFIKEGRILLPDDDAELVVLRWRTNATDEENARS
ncbi:MAG: GNAT family N-acetyltransferase [Bacteroidota bacterium]